MKNKLIAAMIILAVIITLVYAAPRILQTKSIAKGNDLSVFLVYHPSYLKKAPGVLAAYESVLREEGIPYTTANVFQFVGIKVDDLIKRAPVVILPDSILQSVPEQFREWIKEYLSKGGNVAIIYDAGIKHPKGFFLNQSAFTDIVGLNYITFTKMGKAAFDHAYVKFPSEAARDFFQFPLGKTLDQTTFSTYDYGRLQYPVIINEPVREIPDNEIYAYGITTSGKSIPLIVLTKYAKGKVLYAGLPLGYLKANTDDLPLRAIMRTFIIDVVGIPHIMNVAEGRGGIIINWHIDSSVEHMNLLDLQKKRYLRKEIPASFHITAGEFRDEPGDNLGFDACGKGRSLTKMLAEYGRIGSHGGWGHNWFANKIANGVFHAKEIQQYIAQNNQCLEKITGYPIIEYSAPTGKFPQPVSTEVLERLGMIAYYYTGDSGSAPTRAFYENKMITDRVIAFPVMPFGRAASLWEMKTMDLRTENEVADWLFSIPDYTARNRTVRLFYSHPNDIKYYPAAVKGFLDKIETMQRKEEIAVFTMTDYANFFLRFLKTTYKFGLNKQKLVITLENPESLTGITMAIPKGKYQKPNDNDLVLREDSKYYYATVVKPNAKKKLIVANLK